MKPVTLDKIASVTSNCRLSRDVRVTEEIGCREGDVVAVRILSRKSAYNRLELTTGRFSQLKPGDVIAGALGHRRALGGYAGHIPETLEPGATIQVLNLGGVLGACDSFNPDIGPPFDSEVLGQVLHFPYLGERIGIPANITQGAQPFEETIDVQGIPVVAVVGTCMNSGKTLACNSLIQEFTRRHLNVHAAKATGVSLRRDVLTMQDSGAQKTMIFTDLGVVTTTRDNAPRLTRSMLTTLARSSPDIIVLELGDGLMGDYGVDAILDDREIQKSLRAVVLAANDPVGTWGGVEVLRRKYGIDPTVVTGPATDNTAGTDVIRQRMNVEALNARTSADAFASLILKSLELEDQPREGEAHG